MAEWEIKKPLGECYGTGRAIEDGEEYYGALVETEEGLERRDLSSEHWDREKPPVFCFWKTRLSAADEKRSLFVDEDMLMAFFERLGSERDPEKVNFRFVLTLVLMRKRRLKYDGTRLDGDRELWLLRVAGSREIVEVVNPHLDEEQIEQLSGQVGQILQTDF